MERANAVYITYEELLEHYEEYGFPENTVQECMGNLYNFRSDPYVCQGFVFVVIDLLNFQNIMADKNRLAIYLFDETCMVVGIRDENNTIADTFNRVMEHFGNESEQNRKRQVFGLFLYQFFDDLMRNDRKFLENMEIEMSNLETRILKERVDAAFINEILSLKRELIYIRNYYEQLIDVNEVLRDNESELLSKEEAARYDILVQRFKRMNETVKQLKEYSVQLQEIHDAMLDYNLNNIMKFFTVITTIFLPLTLIAGWYGMNFDYMPELHMRYGYPAIIVVSLMIVACSFFAFKKNKLL